MANEMVLAPVEGNEVEAWVVRKIAGVDRISGTELGRRLAYSTSKPTIFNKMVVEKLLKEGKLNDSDIVKEDLQCKKGFGYTTVTEYWLTPAVARSIALEHVWTPAAVELRAQVVAQLERLMERRTAALAAPDSGVLARIEAGQLALLERQGELLQTFREGPKVPSVYIDEERVHLLKGLGRETAAARGDASALPVWEEVRRKYGLSKSRAGRNARVFDTVTVDRFDVVLGYLRAELDKARTAPKKTVPLLPRRPLVPTGNLLSLQAVCRRLKAVGFDVPECACADWETPKETARGLYFAAEIPWYPASDSGKAGRNQPINIDESAMPRLIAWCTEHPLALEALVSNRRMLDAALSRKRVGIV